MTRSTKSNGHRTLRNRRDATCVSTLYGSKQYLPFVRTRLIGRFYISCKQRASPDVVSSIATTWCEHDYCLATVATLAMESRSAVVVIHCDACSYTSIVTRTKTIVGSVRCMGTIARLLARSANGSYVCMRGLPSACLCAWDIERILRQ